MNDCISFEGIVFIAFVLCSVLGIKELVGWILNQRRSFVMMYLWCGVPFMVFPIYGSMLLYGKVFMALINSI